MANISGALKKELWALHIGYFVMKRGHWRKENGEQMKIKDMDTEHIINALMGIRRCGYTKLRCLTIGRKDIIDVTADLEEELNSRNFEDWYLLDVEINSQIKGRTA